MTSDTRRLASICAIAKNEGPYLAEWAIYHRLLGFDSILVFDNDSTDDTREVLERLSAAGILVFRRFPARTDGRVQKMAYAEGLRLLRPGFQWVAFIDIDEFLYIPGFDNSLPKFLDAYAHLDAIAINWSMFGSSRRKDQEPGLVIERFTRRAKATHGANKSIKTLARTDALITPNVHNHEFARGVVYQTVAGEAVPPGVGRTGSAHHGIIQVNHYFTKSAEEWKAKQARGRATKPDDHPDSARKAKDFVKHDRNEVEDTGLLPYAEAIRSKMVELGFPENRMKPAQSLERRDQSAAPSPGAP